MNIPFTNNILLNAVFHVGFSPLCPESPVPTLEGGVLFVVFLFMFLFVCIFSLQKTSEVCLFSVHTLPTNNIKEPINAVCAHAHTSVQ